MAGRRMERIEWTRQVVNTALEKEPTRVSNERHASITQVSREHMSPTRPLQTTQAFKQKGNS